jgi:hypothetical protein
MGRPKGKKDGIAGLRPRRRRPTYDTPECCQCSIKRRRNMCKALIPALNESVALTYCSECLASIVNTMDPEDRRGMVELLDAE